MDDVKLELANTIAKSKKSRFNLLLTIKKRLLFRKLEQYKD